MKYLLVFVMICLFNVSYSQNSNSIKRFEDTLPESDTSALRILEFAEQMPEFPGDLQRFLATNMNYPKETIDSNIQGRVIARFVVNEDGSISDIKIVRSLSPACDAEVYRIITIMPKWKPGKSAGKPVRVYYTQPVTFKLG